MTREVCGKWFDRFTLPFADNGVEIRRMVAVDTVSEIWGELGARIRRFVGSRVEDEHAADDITQDVMLKIQTQLDALPPEEKLPGWVFTVTRNKITDHYRARGVRQHADVTDVEVATDGSDAEQDAAARELASCLTRMVERLPEPYREAMKLADLEGLAQQEIADRMAISLSGAKSRVQRARQQLRAMIVDCCDVERDVRGNVTSYHPTERSARYCGTDEGGEPPCAT
jgi:RNA polymerase sigma-70 factor (ECF subfamily)